MAASRFALIAGALTLALAASTGAARPGWAEPAPPDYETVVVGSRREEKVFDSARSVGVVDRRDMDEQASRTTPEALLEEPGIFVQRTNYGGGMPIIRGQHGNRVLLLVDGIRINNATTRSGPNQFLNTVDGVLADRIEVLRGTGSAVHGSDALGGAINVITEAPAVGGAGQVGGSVLGRAATFDASRGLGARLRWSGERTGAVASGSVRRFGDLRGGAETGLQRFNGYDEWSAAAAAAVAVGERHTLTASVQSTQQYDVLRAFGSTPDDFRLFTRQARLLGYLRHQARGVGPLDGVGTTVSYQLQDEQFDRHRLTRNVHQREDTSVGTVGVQVEATALHPARGSLTAGAELYLDAVATTGAEGPIASDALVEGRELARYAPGAGYLVTGLFANHSLPLGERVRLVGEVRLGAVRVSLPADDRLVLRFPAEGLSPLAAHRELVPVTAGGLHARYAPHPTVALFAGTSLGFRAPNLDDYSRLGVEGTGYVVPTRGLAPERALSGEVGARFLAPSGVSLSLAYAYSYIFDAMTRVPTTLGTLTALDGAPLLRVSNGESARFHSLELAARVPLPARLAVFGNATFTRGDQRRLRDEAGPPGTAPTWIDEPAPKVPPPFGLAGLSWAGQPRRWSVEGFLRFAFAQPRLAEADLADTRICPDVPGRCAGTAGWATVTLRASARLGSALRVTLVAENLADASYRMHASGIDGPGRGLVISVEGMLP